MTSPENTPTPEQDKSDVVNRRPRYEVMPRKEFAIRKLATVAIWSGSIFAVGVGLINIASNEFSRKTDKPTQELIDLNNSATDLLSDLRKMKIQFGDGMDKLDDAESAVEDMEDKIVLVADALGISLTTTTTTSTIPTTTDSIPGQ